MTDSGQLQRLLLSVVLELILERFFFHLHKIGQQVRSLPYSSLEALRSFILRSLNEAAGRCRLLIGIVPPRR